MFRIVLFLVFCCLWQPAHADRLDDINKAIFDYKNETLVIKEKFRQCASNTDCTAALIMCRWRAMNKKSEAYVTEVASAMKFECKWPKPPAEAPNVHCVSRLCDIPTDGKFY